MPTRYHVGTSTPASDNAAGIMASFATLFAVTADVDTGGAVSGMTWTRDSTAGSQAIYSSAFGPRDSRIIIAVHDSGTPAPSPVMVASADTYTAANILIGLCDNAAGAYAGWNQTAPFTGCTFAGYYRLGPSAGASTGGGIRAWVSSKDLWLQYRSTTAVLQAAHAGAVVTGATGFQESDGYRYGLGVSGVGDMSSTWRSGTGTSAGFFGKNGTSNGQAHFGLYGVGSPTWFPIRIEHIRLSAATMSMAKWNGTPVASRTGISMQFSASPEYSVGSWTGVSDGPAGLTASLVNDSTPALWGWLFGSQPSGTVEDSIVIAKAY